MTTAFRTLGDLCITGIEVNLEHLQASTARSVGIVTALTPHLGYAAAADIAKAALAGDGMVRELVLATGLVDGEQLDGLLHPERLAGLPLSTPPSAIG